MIIDDDILPERLKVDAERQKIKAQELRLKLFKIKDMFEYLDNQFDFKQLEEKYFERYERISK